MPEPIWPTVPVPEMALATVSAFERLNSRLPLFDVAPVPSAPVVPPPPTLKVPAEIVVAPE